jgi:hypothetical protein
MDADNNGNGPNIITVLTADHVVWRGELAGIESGEYLVLRDARCWGLPKYKLDGAAGPSILGTLAVVTIYRAQLVARW